MFAVQIGNFAWLDAAGLVTTSIHHAQRFDGQMAGVAQRAFDSDRSPALVHLNRRQRDLYATSPVTVIPVADLDARIRDLTRPGDREGATPITPRVPSPADKEATVRKDGITRQIYNWTLANPGATKADALAAWPSANPSTVSVQFSAARRASLA